MRRIAVILARLFLAGLFIFAGIAKLRQPWPLFAASIDTMQILPEWAVIFVARTLPWFEVALGLTLLSGFLLRYSSTIVTLLLTGFLSILVRSYVRGMTVDCGCFGSGEELGPWTLVRDGALLAVAIWVTYEAFRKPRTRQPQPEMAVADPPAAN